MKTASLIVVIIILTASNLSAMIIETTSERDGIYNRPKSVQAAFGNLFSTEDYGIFLNIQCRVEQGENDKESLFYRLESEVVREDDTLYTTVDGKKIALARKKWLGWKTADGVKIHHSMEKNPHPTFTVWVEVE